MQVLIAYDVATEKEDGKRRLRKVAQVCKNFGQRVQKSVFECLVDQAQYEQLIRDLVKCIDVTSESTLQSILRIPCLCRREPGATAQSRGGSRWL